MTPRVQGMSKSNETDVFVLLTDVIPSAIMEVRYYSAFNFVGSRIDGYEQPVILMTREAAEALKTAAETLEKQGYGIKVFDAYRPQRAVDHFMRWSLDEGDTRMKAFFYPDEDKKFLIPKGYIAPRSGHSRGSTVDLTLFDMKTGRDVDMGGCFDYFGVRSHPDHTEDLNKSQIAGRKLLRSAMLDAGFRPLETEWWHFTLANEPYPDTYFDFPVAWPLKHS